ncbi:arylsulfatase K isoform X2 [Tiliqua scincoides]|uniref:arylsulfatase K isoform X2 n=1 Tax=Tiliqua scincoides TaxID=71010 RepID=UPI0034634D41
MGRESLLPPLAAASPAVVALVLLLLPGSPLGGAVKARPLLSADGSCGKPNVVLVVSDSFDGRLTFHPENETVALPFINLMERYGSVFLNAYTNSPICCPSRAAMWSGLFTHLTESWNNFKGLEPNYTTWMDLMEKHGFYTQQYGKLDYTSGHHSLSNRVEAWTRNVDFLLHQEGRPVADLTGNKTSVRVMQKDWKATDEAATWIRTKATNLTQPFVLYLGLNLPHPYPSESSGENYGSSTFLTSPYWLERVIYKAIKIPRWTPFSEMHPVDYYSSYTKNCTGKFTQKEIRDIRAHYYAMCAETDAMLGEIISALNETELLHKTLVIFTADHGELAMEHRQFYKMSMYEASSHIPLLIMGPNIKSQLISNVVSLVDIYPTMLDIARIPIPKNCSGYSLMPLVEDKAKEAPSRRLRPTWVLNLSADPDELTNVATKFPAITESLNKKLLSIVDYPKVSAKVQEYNKQQFINWKQNLGQNYSETIANLRWHQDWKKNPKKYEYAIDRWIKGDVDV